MAGMDDLDAPLLIDRELNMNLFSLGALPSEVR